MYPLNGFSIYSVFIVARALTLCCVGNFVSSFFLNHFHQSAKRNGYIHILHTHPYDKWNEHIWKWKTKTKHFVKHNYLHYGSQSQLPFYWIIESGSIFLFFVRWRETGVDTVACVDENYVDMYMDENFCMIYDRIDWRNWQKRETDLVRSHHYGKRQQKILLRVSITCVNTIFYIAITKWVLKRNAIAKVRSWLHRREVINYHTHTENFTWLQDHSGDFENGYHTSHRRTTIQNPLQTFKHRTSTRFYAGRSSSIIFSLTLCY